MANPPSLRIIRDRMEADRFNVNIEKLLAASNQHPRTKRNPQQASTIKKSKSIAAAATSAVSSWSLGGQKLRPTPTSIKSSSTQTRSINGHYEDEKCNSSEEKDRNMKILKKLKSKSFLSQIRSVKQNFSGGVANSSSNGSGQNTSSRLLSNSRMLKKRSSMRKGKSNKMAANKSTATSLAAAMNTTKAASVTTDIKIISRFPINSKAYRHYIAGNGNKSDKLTNSVEVKNVIKQERKIIATSDDEAATISFVGGNERGWQA